MNFSEAQKQLTQYEEEVYLLTQRLSNARLRLTKRSEEWEKVKDEMYREKLDVDKLEKVSLSSVLSKILGNFDEKHEKEYQEYILAKKKYDEFAAAVDEVRKEIERYQCEILHKKERIKKLKESIRNDCPEGKVIAEQEEQERRQLYREKKEIEEAISAAQTVLSLANEACSQYQSAKSWSTYDTFFNGGLISDMVKYDKIDSAAELSSQLQRAGNRMAKELNDVNLVFDDTLDNMDNGTRFFDIAFDNIFTDWNVRERLIDNIDKLNKYIRKVNQIIGELKRKLCQIDNRINELTL